MSDPMSFQDLNDQQLVERLIKAAMTLGEFSTNVMVTDQLKKSKKKELNAMKDELLRRLGVQK